MATFVDGIAVLLSLTRSELPAMRPVDAPTVNVFEDLPDRLAEKLPAVVIRRTGGASDWPRFMSQFWVHIQVWDTTPEKAYELSTQVAQLLYAAWENQTTTPHGHIARWRESSGFKKFPDPDLPFVGRYDAVYDLMIRVPRSA